MPLNRKNINLKSAEVDKGNPVQSPDGKLMSLFDKAKLPAITLNVEQFAFPETFLVVEASRVPVYAKNEETGWDKKDANGNKTKTGEYNIRLQVVDGDAAQKLVDAGLNITGLSSIKLTITKDLPLQEFEINSTLVRPKKVNVMLGYGGMQSDQIVLVAEDCEIG